MTGVTMKKSGKHMEIGIVGNGKIIATASGGFKKAGIPMTALAPYI